MYAPQMKKMADSNKYHEIEFNLLRDFDNDWFFSSYENVAAVQACYASTNNATLSNAICPKLQPLYSESHGAK